VYLGVYELLDDKDELPVEGEDPLTYVGSGTNVEDGVKARVRAHELGRRLPRYVATALDLGYTRTSTGVMLSLSTPKINIIRTRAFIRLMEATFTYKLWTVYCTRNDNHQYAMERLSLWNRRDLAWGGLCSHTPLLESLTVNLPEIDSLAASLGWANVAEQYEEFSRQMAEHQLEGRRARSRRARKKFFEAVKAGDEAANARWQKESVQQRLRQQRLRQAAAAGGVAEMEKIKKRGAQSAAGRKRLRASARAGDEEAKAKVSKLNERKRELKKIRRELKKIRRELAEAGNEEAKASLKNQSERARLNMKRIQDAARTGKDEKAKAQIDRKIQRGRERRKSLLEAAAAGDEEAQAKVQQAKKVARERAREKRKSLLEAAAAGDEEAKAKVQQAKEVARERERKKRKSLLEAAAAGNEEAQAKVQQAKKKERERSQERRRAKGAKGL
jgi:hypothetical protein